MKSGTYIGKVVSLRGQRALLRACPSRAESVLAQFNTFGLRFGDGVTGPDLSHGWHEFSVGAFEPDLDLDIELET